MIVGFDAVLVVPSFGQNPLQRFAPKIGRADRERD